ncbi:MAG: Na+ dependent nucleoside transporter [Sphingomonadales bacterium]|nr:Na+ dependent nucleoside transporter [Sphingomonadales bacterium]
MMMALLNGLIGLCSLLGLLYLLSENRRRISWRTILPALGLQLALAVMVLKVPLVGQVFSVVSGFIVELLGFSRRGAEFLFGGLVTSVDTYGFIFVFQVLPTIIFFSAFTSLLFYLGILQRIVFGFAWVMNHLLKISGAESLAASANIFMGQTEAPLLIKPYLNRMTRSEIMALMTGGMATIAGGVMAAYIGFLGGNDPHTQALFARHLLTASVMAAPAGILAAKMLVPETEEFLSDLSVPRETMGDNVLEAVATGTTDGVKLAVNVGAMLLVFMALMAMFNYMLQHWVGGWTGFNTLITKVSGGRYDGLSVQLVLGMMFAPISWLMGVRGEDVLLIGQLLGEKAILNEFVAFSSLSELKASGAFTSERTIVMASYALCGFANVASIGIQVGGIGSLVPQRRTLFSQLGVKALIAGTAASLLNATIAGMLIGF